VVVDPGCVVVVAPIRVVVVVVDPTGRVEVVVVGGRVVVVVDEVDVDVVVVAAPGRVVVVTAFGWVVVVEVAGMNTPGMTPFPVDPDVPVPDVVEVFGG
jgi:hypothetical protein